MQLFIFEFMVRVGHEVRSTLKWSRSIHADPVSIMNCNPQMGNRGVVVVDVQVTLALHSERHVVESCV